MIKAYKYKLKPTEEQRELLSKFFGCTRFIYNWGLSKKTSAYKENGTHIGYLQLARELTNLKKEEEYQWLNETPNVSLQQALRNLDSAFTSFFRKKNNYPRFKSKKRSKDSAKFINSVHFDFNDWKVKLPKLGWVNICMNRPFNQTTCKQGTCTVSRDHCGDYWCSVVIDDLKSTPTKAKLDKDKAVGIDLGLKDLAILSDGTKFHNPKHFKESRKRLAHLQKVFARTEKKSVNHEKMRVKVAKCHRHIRNQRIDGLHKLTAYLVNHFETICLEDLNIKGMMKSHKLAGSIQDASWCELVRQLTYKADWKGKNVLFIGRFDPSSKMCHCCGYVNRELKLEDREWTCPECGTHHDRDVNAAINIKEIAFDKQNLIGI